MINLENPTLRASPQVGLAGGLKSWLGFAGSMTGTAALSSGPEKRVDCHDHHDGGHGGGGHGDGGHGDDAVTCESLVSREFSRILSTFHFSISISRHFHFTFHSRSRSQGIFISLFILEMSERKTKFTFQFSKRVKAFQISLFFSRKKSKIMHETLHFVMKNHNVEH